MRRRHAIVVASIAVVAAVGCAKESAPAPADSASSVAAGRPVAAGRGAFDIESFCEKVMSVGRPCAGDDELMEGNKVGLCTTTLRAARDDDGAKLDEASALTCIAEVRSAKPPLPDIRTLDTLAKRFDGCRAFTKEVPALRAVSAVALGTVGAGAACNNNVDCQHGLFCSSAQGKTEAKCTPLKKAGEPCAANGECVGRCSRQDGNVCVPYCGAG